MAAPTYGVSTKPIEVPQFLQDGEKFIKWDEESGAGVPVTLRVDGKGFFLYWTDQNMEVEMLDIATISDVRTGQYAKVPKDARLRALVGGIGSAAAGALEDKTVSVCHGADFVNVTFVNFCCARADIAQAWTAGVFSLAYNVHQSNCSALRALEKLHARLALRADKDRRLPVKSIVRQFAAGKEERRRVEKALAEAGLPAGKADLVPLAKFAFEDFFNFYKCLTQRREVQAIFDKLSEGKPVLGAAALVEFLNEVQRDPRLNEILHPYADAARARELVQRHEPNKYHRARDQLSSDGFLRFLLSQDNPAVAPARLDLADDMDQPLAHYFINSSHNTYLTGHQITGKSSVEMYRQSLLAGCRCVELDFWNGRTEEPVVVHGYTFVPEVPARDVLEAIAESAFKTSDFPVILSFENHCNPRQQAKIAAYCRDIFKDMLLDRPLDSHPLDPGGELPSPWSLRRKIIIKNKKKHHHHHKREPVAAPVEELPQEAPEAVPEGPDGALPRHSSKESLSSTLSESSSGEEEDEEGAGAGAGEGVAGGVAAAPASAAEERETHAGAEISALVNYVQPVHFTSFENAEKKNRFYEMSSFDEKQATTLLKERPVEFVNYNKAQLSRVYPAGTRFDSSNFMPQVFWNAGCQLVALNYQTLDLAMQLNLAAFEYNLRCGYLLKPEFMRRRDRRLDPFAESTVDGIVAGAVSVSVLSGQLLSDRRTGVYVEVDLFGLPADTVRKRFRTRTVHNALNPVFEEEPFVFKKVVLPELAWLRLAAHEEGGRLLGHRALPLAALRPGYRHVTLRSELGRPSPAALLLRLTVADYVPDTLAELAEALANPIKYQSELDKREQQLRVLVDAAEPPPAAPAAAPVAAPCPVPCPAPAPAPATTAPASTAPATTPAPPAAPAGEDEVQALLQCRAARQQRAELARKLDALRRKHARSRFSTHKLVKRLSALNISSSSSEGVIGGSGCAAAGEEAEGGGGGGGEAAGRAAERELRLRYHHSIFAALEKHARNQHQLQMKELTELLETEKKEVLSRLAAARKEDVRALAKRANRDKDEVLRIKREIHAQSVERGVAECSRLEAAHAARRELLAARHERARARLQALRDQELGELEALCGDG